MNKIVFFISVRLFQRHFIANLYVILLSITIRDKRSAVFYICMNELAVFFNSVNCCRFLF